MPYSGYETYDFEVATSDDCDCYGRYLVRIKEMRESVKTLRQALDRLPDGPVNVDDRKMLPPPREELETSMEAVIHHFKLFTEGYSVPPGDVYVAVESGRGENGCYIVSDGAHKPRRVKFRWATWIDERSPAPHPRGDSRAPREVSATTFRGHARPRSGPGGARPPDARGDERGRRGARARSR